MRRIFLICAACATLSASDPKDLVTKVTGYEFGGDPAAVRELEALSFHAAGSSDAPSLEKVLLGGLQSARTVAAKDALCRDLTMVGSDAAVPQLEAMLGEPGTAEMARYALERIASLQAKAALRRALARTSPPIATGIVVSLGRLRDPAAVDAIRTLLNSKDGPTAAAAADALYNIANAAARDALLAAIPAPAVSAALLGLAERSNAVDAAAIYRRLNSARQTEAVQVAALEGLTRGNPKEAAPLLHAALKSGSVRLQAMAVRELARIEGAALAAEMPNVPELAKVQIIAALADSGLPEMRPVLLQGVASDSEAVRVASLNGLAKLGTAANIGLLAGRAAASSGDEQAAARAALGNLRDAAADTAILRALATAEPKIKIELIRAIGARNIASASDVLLGAASDPNRAVRLESVRALRETAGSQQVPALVTLLVKASSETERKEFERTLAAALRRSRGSSVAEAVEAYRSAKDAEVRISLLNVMSAAGNPEAIPVVRQALQDPDPEIQRAALKDLSAWPTADPLNDLLALARSASDPAQRILALRGYITLAQIPANRTPAETAALLKTAMGLASQTEEKRAVLAAAQKIVCAESLQLARSAIRDPEVEAEARLAATTLERGLSYVNK
jgi:HEAT repeat protein